MNFNVSPNIILEENTSWGNPDYAVIRSLLYMVDTSMKTALDCSCFSTKKCFVRNKEGIPLCTKAGDDHIIYLSAKDNYWCQWVYQFAHEYCHHLIDGLLSGEWSSMLWFEETICELSSLYNLNRMIGFCMTNDLQGYAPSVDVYLKNLLKKNKDIFCLSVEGGWYKQFEDSLKVKQYHRDLYNAIAVMMYPLFIHNPNLWKIILNIGDIRSWSSLEELFGYLQSKADVSYSASLKRMQKMFS